MMSKSKVSCRRWYCDVSTMRTLALMPELLQRRLVGQHDALEVGLHQQELGRQLHALRRWSSTPSLGFQPASASSFAAFDKCLRASSGVR